MDRVVLVTGANGFVGRHVVRACSRRKGYRVVAVDLHERSAHSGPPDMPVEYLQCNLATVDAADTLCSRGPFTDVIHLAGFVAKGDDDNTYRTAFRANTEATLHALQAAQACNAAFVFPSTGLIYGNRPGPFTEDMTPNPGDFYALSKLLCEQLIDFYARRHGMRTVVLRPSIIYGPSQTGSMLIPSLLDALREGRPFPMTAGEQKRDFVFIDDVVRAFLLAIDGSHAAGVFNIASGTSTPIRDVAALTESLTRTTGLVRYGELPYREHEVWEYALDNTLATRELGWAPQVGLEDGIRRTIERANGE